MPHGSPARHETDQSHGRPSHKNLGLHVLDARSLRAVFTLQSPRHRRTCLALLLLVLLPSAWWYPLLSGDLPNFMDTITHGFPIRMAVARQIREGTLPLWIPNLFSGAPLAANPQIAVWYPPQALFYLAPGAISFGLVCVLHYVWGGWGAFFYVRRMTGSMAGALFAAVTFQFSAMLVSRVALMPHVFTTVWVPWMFLAAERALDDRGFHPRQGALILAVLVALQILAGSPQITYYTGLALPLYWIARAVLRARCEKGAVMRRVAEVLVQGAVAAVLAAFLAGIQLLPTAEFLQNSERTAISLDRLRGQALNDSFIWTSLVGFTGDTIEDTDSINAIGPGALALGLLALGRRSSRRLALPLWLVAIAGFLLSLGPLVAAWADLLPLYGRFHAPRRALVFWTIAGCLAAGAGGAYLDACWRARRLPRSALHGLLLLLTAGTWWMLPRLEKVFVHPGHLDPDPRIVERIGQDRFLTLDPTFAYSYDSRRPDFGRSMISNLAALSDTFDVNGYDPLVPSRYGEARNLACTRSGVFFPSHGVFFSDPNSPVLKLLNVQYVLGRHDLYDPDRLIPGTRIDHAELSASLELIYPDDRWPLSRYREERPLAWAVEKVFMARNAREALQNAILLNPWRVAFVEEDIGVVGASRPPAVTACHKDARTITVRLDGPRDQDSLVCIATTWMPGWSARSSTGERLVTVPADGIIAGVVVPQGVTEFDLVYSPASFVRGLLMTAAGFLAWGLFWSRRRKAAPRGTA